MKLSAAEFQQVFPLVI